MWRAVYVPVGKILCRVVCWPVNCLEDAKPRGELACQSVWKMQGCVSCWPVYLSGGCWAAWGADPPVAPDPDFLRLAGPVAADKLLHGGLLLMDVSHAKLNYHH
jgi:hypothetical protein